MATRKVPTKDETAKFLCRCTGGVGQQVNTKTEIAGEKKNCWQICYFCLEDSWSEYNPGHRLEFHAFPPSIQADSNVVDPP